MEYSFQLMKLPYDVDALAPHMSKESLEFHYLKHHKAYIDNLNNLVVQNKIKIEEEVDLYKLIVNYRKGPIFNNAAQVFNHNFFWMCLTPKSTKQPKGDLLEKINEKWGNFRKFKEEFSKVAISTFGSGWAWLIKNNQGNLEIISTNNAENPLIDDQIPLLTCDVWEHAYYIDYRNSRFSFIEAFWNLVNWDFVEENLFCERKWNNTIKSKPNF